MRKSLSLPAIRKFESMGFCVAAQPIVTGDIKSIPQVAGYQLLPRFRSENQQILTPEQFSSDMSREHLITMDALAVQEGIGAAVSEESSQLFYSLNLRISNLSSFWFAKYLTSHLGVMKDEERARLVIEISESHLANGKSFLSYLPHLKRTLFTLTEMGVRICVDDFNHRSNGFRFVSELPVTAVKFSAQAVRAQKRFLAKECDEREAMDLEVMRSFGISMKSWGCMVIADGIESPEQAEIAMKMGANYFQGNQFGRPLIESDLPDELESGPIVSGRSYRDKEPELSFLG